MSHGRGASRKHVVSPGEHLWAIAARYGLPDANAVWNDPANRELAERRGSPHILLRGDVVTLPEIEAKTEAAESRARHRFVVRRSPLRLRLALEDECGNALDSPDVEMADAKGARAEPADENGVWEWSIPAQLARARISIVGAVNPERTVGLELRIGALDPVSVLSGQVARLENLAYGPGEPSDARDPGFVSAVEEFQCDEGLAVDGICGPKTQARLEETHGC